MCADMCLVRHTYACMQLLLSGSIALLNTIDAERRRGERTTSMPSVTDNFLSPSLHAWREGTFFNHMHGATPCNTEQGGISIEDATQGPICPRRLYRCMSACYWVVALCVYVC